MLYGSIIARAHFEQLFAAARLWGIAAARHGLRRCWGRDPQNPLRIEPGLEGQAVAHAGAWCKPVRSAEPAWWWLRPQTPTLTRSSDSSSTRQMLDHRRGTTCGTTPCGAFKAKSAESLRSNGKISLQHPAERLGLEVQFSEAARRRAVDYRPNFLTNYLFDNLAKSFTFSRTALSYGPNSQDSRLLLASPPARSARGSTS